MRALALVALAVAMIMLSCGHPTYPHELTQADSLCEANPYMAKQALANIDTSRLNHDGDEYWYYQLLRTKAIVKTYEPLTHTDSARVHQVLHHYANGGDSRLLPQAYYHAGCYYRDIDNAPMAIDMYFKGLDAIKDTTDYKMRSVLHFRIGVVMGVQGLYDEALKHYKESYRLENMRRDTIMMAYCLEKIAMAYEFKRDKDKAIHHYRKAAILAKAYGDTILEKDIVSSMALPYLNSGDYEMANNLIEPYMDCVAEPNKMAMYAIASIICWHSGNYDSVKSMSYELLRNGNVYQKRTASLWLSKFFSKMGDNKKSYAYLDTFDIYLDSALRITSIEAIANANAYFNYSKFQIENAELKAERAHYIMYIIVLVSLGTVGTSFYVIGRKRYKQRLARQEELRINLQMQSSKFIAENERKIASLQLQLMETQQMANEQTTMLEQQKALLEVQNKMATQRKNIADTINTYLLESDAYKLVHGKLKNSKVLSDDDWDSIENCIIDIIPNFKMRIFSIASISKQDYRLCLLMKIGGLTGNDMATLMGRTKSAISKAKKKLHDLFIDEENSSTLAEFINNL